MDLNSLFKSDSFDISALPEQIKEVENLVKLLQNNMDKLLLFVKSNYNFADEKNLFKVELIPIKGKIFVWLKEITEDNGKEKLVKTHYKGELFNLFEVLKTWLPVQASETKKLD